MLSGGQRNKNVKKQSGINTPLLSIVTVVRNCEQSIEQTITSVINQDYKNIEYIIIDGGSTDGTISIIQKFENKIDLWISESDNGIYDAMNKGIKLSTGEWLNFMNAGDEFKDNEICNLIAKHVSSNICDIVYGDFIAKNIHNGTEITINAKPLSTIWKGMNFSHQSTFIKLELLKLNLFNLNFKIVADYDLIMSFYLRKKTFNYIPVPLSKIQIGGLSYSNINTIIEQIKVIHSHKPFSLKLRHTIIPLLLCALPLILGSRLTNLIREFKWKIKAKHNNLRF